MEGQKIEGEAVASEVKREVWGNRRRQEQGDQERRNGIKNKDRMTRIEQRVMRWSDTPANDVAGINRTKRIGRCKGRDPRVVPAVCLYGYGMRRTKVQKGARGRGMERVVLSALKGT
jgi:hypothetical protein